MHKQHQIMTMFFGLFYLILFACVEIAEAQQPPTRSFYFRPTTDPTEARAINTIFARWRIAADSRWNISGELCSGIAIDNVTDLNFYFNPGIKCDCSYNASTVCHVISLRVNAMSDANLLSDVVGPIPDELWSLTYLTSLDLGQNYLTGPLSSSVGNLTRMQYLTLRINAFSGLLPNELGRLTDLRSLVIGTNNFDGPLPSELGNCIRLEQLWIDSSGIGGPIPPTLASLKNMQIFYALDVALSGRIPDFIGSWSRLTTLRLEGNSLRGPIPSTFSNLTSLTDLRIYGLSGGSSSLSFLHNMKSLSTLILRNNNISGSIPSNFDEYESLSLLDLSFNYFSGRIPDSLFNISGLIYLFLGNNALTGPLPQTKMSRLQYIDLSYNQLSGSLPSWTEEHGLQLNLVANNYTLQASDSSYSLQGLNCLQRNFPCNRGNPQYSSFEVNCGGPQTTSPTGIVYEADNVMTGPAAYYITRELKWAVSNVGLPSGMSIYFLSYLPDTGDPEMSLSTRLSSGSLRYYGLGLENGGYNIKLQFVENQISDGYNWRSLGRRVFDIYIQGNLVRENFDIKKEANGSFRAVESEFTARVTDNYLEIHLLWAGKGTCCVPNQGVYGPSISAISVTPELLGLEAKPNTYSYAELRTATDGFNDANKLGEGGFGPVYKGKLDDGRIIAVKKLSVASHQGKSQFAAEIATISAVQHRNLVTLYGCCIEGNERLLVYEYLENNSLDQALFGHKKLSLDWPTRFNICLGVARGLAYLHEESRLRIVHRDVKASNILLDSQLNPKISDFGLAKLYDDTKTHISTRVAGTIGYLAPEYALRGHLTEKADVFGFGVVALEIVSGRANSDASFERDRIYLLEWAWHCHENKHELDLVDPNLSEFNEDEVTRVIGISLLCTQTSPSSRPSMSRVVAMLCGDIEIPDIISKPVYLTDWNFSDASTFMIESEEFNSVAEISSYDTSPSLYMNMSNRSPVPASEPMLRGIDQEGK